MEFKPSISPEQFDMMQGGGQPTSSASPSQKYAGGFDAAASFTLGEEGGYVKDDAGAGETNFGINKRANPDVDIKSLTESGARDLYKTRYWNPIGGDELAKRNPILATIAFDTAINMGPTTAKNFLRAANGDPAKVLEMRAERYRDLLAADPKKFGKYADGWQSRMDKLYELAGTQQPAAQPTNDFSGEGSTAGGIDWNAKEKGFVDRASEGFKRGFDQSIGLGQAAAALVNRTVTGEKYNEFQDEMLQAAGKRMQPEGSAPTPQFSDVVSGGANFKDWLADSVGYLGYQAVEMAASFGIGGLIGKNIAKGAVKEVAEGMIEKEVARLAATDAAKTLSKDEIGALAVKNVAGEIAGSMATFANNLRQTSGGVYMEALDNEAKTGKPADLTNAWVGSIGSALVDTAADIAGARGILGKAGSGNATFLGRAATQVPRQMGIQGGTEYLQSNIENAAAGTDPFTEKAQIQALNEGAVGALGGVFPGLGEARVQRATNPLQSVIDHAEKPGSVLSRAVVSTGVTDQAAAAAASEALPPAADDLVQRVRDVEAGMRNGPVLDNLRDDGVDTRELLNDMQLARRTDAPRVAREAALERIETAIHFANQDAQPRAPLDSIQSNPAFDFTQQEQVEPQQIPDLSAVSTALRDPNLRNTISDEDRDQLLYLYNIAGNSKGDTVVRTNAARQALEIVGRYQTPVGTPGSTTPALEQAAQAGAAIATPAEQQTVAAEPKELDFLQAVPEPKVGIPAGEGPAFLRKRAAVVKQLVDNGFETVQRDSKDFYLTNTKTGQKFKLDGSADAQLARKAIKDRVDALAATNEKNPSQAKINANNYKKSDVIDLNGMKIKIENERGDIRRGVGPDGTPWETKMAHHYGEFQGTIGADGDKLDVFIGQRPDSNKVYVVDQVNQDGSFDEHKVMMGFTSKEDASSGYLANYEKGWTGLGAITEMSVDEFKTWAKSRAAKKPASSVLENAAAAGQDQFTEEEKAEEKSGKFFYVNDGEKQHKLKIIKPGELSKKPSAERPGNRRPLTQADAALIEKVAALLGKNVVFFEAQEGRLSDGFVRPGQPDTIYVATETTVNPLAIFGHEFFHTLRETNPKAWDAVAAVVGTKVTAAKRFRKDRYGKKVADAKGDAALSTEVGGELEELVSDLGGNLLKDSKFWKEVFAKIEADNGAEAKGIIAKLSAAIQSAITRIVKAINQPGYRADSFVKDLDQVRAAFVDAMAAHLKNGDVEKMAATANQKIKKSEDRDGLTVEGYHFSKAPRTVLTTAMFGTGLKGSAREDIKNNPDQRLRQRLSFYFDKGTGINPEAGVGSIAHKATLTNIYDADADPLRLRTGDARAFESKVLDNGYSGYLQRMQGTQSGQVILLGKQTVKPEILGAVGKITNAEVVPAPKQRAADVGDQIMANKDLPAGALTPTQWSEALMQKMPEVAAQLMDIGAFEGNDSMYKDELVAKARQLSSQIKKSADRARDEYAEVEAKYKGTDEWLKAPNGESTNLSERQWIQVRTPSFKKWFGDWEKFAGMQGGVWNDAKNEVSKAVDKNGEPLVVYHGTNKGGFSEFNTPGGEKRGDLGIFTTPNLEMAQTYYSRRGGEIDLSDKDQGDLEDIGYQFKPGFIVKGSDVGFFDSKEQLLEEVELDPGEEIVEAWDVTDPNGYNVDGPRDHSYYFESLADAVGTVNLNMAQESTKESGYYALFANIRNPSESDFEGANWEGSREGQYNVINQDGEQVYDKDGKGVFNSYDEAQEVQFANPGTTVEGAADHYETTDDVVLNAKRYGNDGAYMQNVVDAGPGGGAYIDEPSDIFVALDPSQLKSANYNSGEFSVDSSDLRFSKDRLTREDPFEMSTRIPTAKGKVVEDHAGDLLISDFAAGQKQEKWVNSVANLVAQYPNYREADSAKTPAKKLERLVRHMVENLVWLHNQVPAETRQRSKLWYDGANRIAERMSRKYELTPAQSSGILAVLSPQKDWFMNVSLGERVASIMAERQNFQWSKDMDATANRIYGAAKYQEDVDAIRGKSLSDLDGKAYLQAMWVRTYDQAHNSSSFNIVSPEGDSLAIAKAKTGNPVKVAWGGNSTIAKAISIFNDGSASNISEQLGTKHKVRNFFNNILVPKSKNGHVTIDTHAVAAALLRPLSGNSLEVMQNFGGTSNAISGLQGTYALYEEAYRRAAEELGLLPRELQSITWEAVRGLYTPGFKSQSKNVDAVDKIWNQYKKGRLSYDGAKEWALETAGGIEPPSWLGRDPGAYVEDESSIEPGDVSGDGVSGRDSEDAFIRAVGDDSGAAEESIRQSGDREGRDESGGIAPLAGAPTVQGASGPDPRLVQVANKYASDNGITLRRQAEYVEVDPERAARIAAAYEAMPHAPQDRKVKAAFANLIRQTRAQYDALVDAGYKFTFFDSKSDPYGGNPWNAMRDLRENQRMAVYGTYDGYGTEGVTKSKVDDNPMLADTGLEWEDQNGKLHPVLANDLFRAVHDAFGHGLEGTGFRARGEENAWQAHIRMFTGSAKAAITTETRGQNSWLNYGPYGEKNRVAKVEDTVFAEQKTGLMPEWTWSEGLAEDMPTKDEPTYNQRVNALKDLISCLKK
jgi:hypothetical protein